MIVQCPSCTSRYRIRDANIPPSGGKIRCPSCAHSFIVYPDAEEEDDQKTSITGSNEIAKLAGNMTQPDDGATEIVGGDELDKMRAIEALKREMGSALEGDGTVEIQNPLDMWKAAQSGSAAELQDEQEPVAEYGDPSLDPDEYDTAKTEIVSPDALDFSSFDLSNAQASDKPAKPSIPRPNAPSPSEDEPPSNIPWQDPDRTIDAGLSGGTNGLETASVKAPDRLPPMRDDLGQQNQQQTGAPQSSSPGGPPSVPSPPPRPGASQAPQDQPNQPQSGQQNPQQGAPSTGLSADELFGSAPAQSEQPQPQSTQAPATQEDSGPSAPTTDPFSLPESNPFASAGGSSPADVPSVPVGGQSEEAFAANAQEEPAGGPDPRHQGPWKLKTNFGLTYEFPDNKSLRSWMSSREELDGHTLSADGNNFYELNEFPQLFRSPSMVSQQIPSYSADQRPPSGGYQAQQPPGMGPANEASHAPTGAPAGAPAGQGMQGNQPPPPPQTPSSPGQIPSPGFTSPAQFGSGPQQAMSPNQGLGSASSAPNFANKPADRSNTVQNEYVPPSQDSAWDKVLWLVLAVLILAAGVIAIQTFGIFDVVGEVRALLGMPAQTEQAVVPETSTSNDDAVVPAVDAEALEEQQSEIAEKLLRDARKDVEKNRLPAALQKLETVAEIDDSNVAIYEMRVQIYEELGQTEEAEAAKQKMEEIQNVGIDEDADAGTPDAS